MKRFLCLMALCLFLPGCSFIGNMRQEKTADVADVYLDEFADIPIPQIMKVDRRQSMVSITSEGAKTGLVTAGGNVDKVSLSSAMIHNMSQQGWMLRGMVRGVRIIELFEKDRRFAVLSFYDKGMGGVTMELWVGQRLADGVVPVETTGNGAVRPSVVGAGIVSEDPSGSTN